MLMVYNSNSRNVGVEVEVPMASKLDMTSHKAWALWEVMKESKQLSCLMSEQSDQQF